MPDTLTADLERIARHLPCLEAAAADPTAPLRVRERVAAMAALARTAVDTVGSRTAPDETERRTDLTAPERNGTFRNETGTPRNGGER